MTGDHGNPEMIVKKTESGDPEQARRVRERTQAEK